MTNQNDFVIDNGTGLAVRQDIQDALQALAGLSSGDSAPSTTYAFQLYANTSTDMLQIRNAANSAFIDLFQLDGTFTLEDGSAASPALAFRDDLDTGIFSPNSNVISFATGGVERLQLSTGGFIFNESGADIDFRIEGDTDANLFYVDAGNNRIGINDSTPLGKLHIISSSASITSVNADANELVLENNGNCGMTIASSGTTQGAIAFADSGNNDIGRIIYDHNDNSMFFKTADSQRMTIDSSGNVGINQVPTRELSLHSPNNNNALIHFTNDDTGETSADGILVGLDGNENMVIHNQETGKNINFFNGGLERISIDSTGNLNIADGNLVIGTAGHGIDFSAQTATSQSGATASAEILDHYEEGSWTPVYVFGTTNNTATYSVQQGMYTRIGRMVYVSYSITSSNINSSTGTFNIGGLPFSSTNTPVANIGTNGLFPISGISFDGEFISQQLTGTQIELYGVNKNASGNMFDQIRDTDINGTGGITIKGSIFYNVA